MDNGAAVTPPLSGRAAPQPQQSDHGNFSDTGQSFSRDGGRYSAPHPHRGTAVPMARSSLGWSPSQSGPAPRTFVPMDVAYGLPSNTTRSMGRSSLSYRPPLGTPIRSGVSPMNFSREMSHT